jgi:two-component system chemotaxis sensor kinase CheA
MENLISIFVGEATELLNDLEKALLQLEKDKQSKQGISEAFRIMHSLKGAANMFGFEAINNLTHNLETIYQAIRDDGAQLTNEIFSTTLACLDHLKALLENPKMDDPELQKVHAKLIQEINHLSAGITKNPSQKAEVVSAAGEATYYVYFKPAADILRNGTNTLYLIDELLSLGKGISLPFFHDLPEWNEIKADASYTAFEIVLTTSKLEQEIHDVFIFVEDESEIEIVKLEDKGLITDETKSKLKVAHHFQKKMGVSIVRNLIAQKEETQVTKASEQKAAKNVANVRVSSERLDELMNLVSELVTTQASLSLLAEKNNSPELTAVAETVEKLTRRLRDNAFTMSLIPVENLAVRFQRLVRDLSKGLKKEILFLTEGTETEIDKSIIEKLSDPIMHLIRNGLDHGIELPEERVKKGKPRQGTIQFKAYYSGANVIIEISDDGAGINTEKVRAKAVQKGLISADVELSEKEVLNLIFLPGFSTSDTITAVSGRGVGMDVVRRNIADIRGEIEIQSKAGEGSTFTIKLPLTLSIIDGLRVNIGDSDFILPLSSVEKCYEIESSQLSNNYNQWTTLDGERTPYFYLRNHFNATTPAPQYSQIIKISSHLGQIGLVVDKIIGDYQAVLKPLGQAYRNQQEFSGATILGDGTVALVIDPLRLINKLKDLN